ncbi:unnamed protein product [Moneuplotes crassus]|uniref:Uncharacterized protein n=1 Tax=Euplotes crassus TaxID=5936 RepID=A0AAD1XZ48_EUPCR|nr:unnamed protein product [Moneuplotes crassus]
MSQDSKRFSQNEDEEDFDFQEDLKAQRISYGKGSIWSDFSNPMEQETLFYSKSLLAQSQVIVRSLLWKDDAPYFKFDFDDDIRRNEVLKSMITAGISTTVITIMDIRVLNMLKAVRKYSILQKLLLIQVMNSPFYIYFYTTINKSYLDLKKYLVLKYLVKDNEKVFTPDCEEAKIEASESNIL